MKTVKATFKNKYSKNIREYFELLKSLDEAERLQVKGIMIGMLLAKKVKVD